MSPNERLVVFLYLLGREAVTLGELERIIDRAQAVKDVAIFSNVHLEGWARDAADRLTVVEP